MDNKSGVAPQQVQILTGPACQDDPVFTRFLRKNLAEENTVYFIGTSAGELATPAPGILPVSDILFDFWALSTLRGKVPGRPPV